MRACASHEGPAEASAAPFPSLGAWRPDPARHPDSPAPPPPLLFPPRSPPGRVSEHPTETDRQTQTRAIGRKDRRPLTSCSSRAAAARRAAAASLSSSASLLVLGLGAPPFRAGPAAAPAARGTSCLSRSQCNCRARPGCS